MNSNKIVKMNEKGKITIPISIRKKFRWNPGAEFEILELDGHVSIVPILDPETLPKMTPKQYTKIFEESRKDELELEL